MKKVKDLIALKSKTKQNQRGMASIVVVTVLIVLLSLTSIGFARLMNRAINRSLDNQLASSATFAAQSGMNDAIKYLQKQINAGNLPNNTNCNEFITGSPPAINPNLSGTGNNDSKYTCILINAQGSSKLTYDPVTAFKSKVIKLNTNPISSAFQFSWQDNNADCNPTCKTNLLPAGTKTLYDQDSWANGKYVASPLRLTIYPIFDTAPDINLTAIQNASRTYYLNPTDGNTPTVIDAADTSSNFKLVPVNCNSPAPDTVFKCKVLISSLTSIPQLGGAVKYYYVRITPLYNDADVQINGHGVGGAQAFFTGTQATVDVTAQSGGVFKRLQARVDITDKAGAPNFDDIPEYGIRSAMTICKALYVDPNAPTPTPGARGTAYEFDPNCRLTFPCGQGPWDPSCNTYPPCDPEINNCNPDNNPCNGPSPPADCLCPTIEECEAGVPPPYDCPADGSPKSFACHPDECRPDGPLRILYRWNGYYYYRTGAVCD